MKYILSILSIFFYAQLIGQIYDVNPKTRGAINVEYAGLKGDYVSLSGLSINASSTTVTSSSAVFSSADVGKTLIIYGAGRRHPDSTAWNGDEHISLITGFTSTTQVTIANAAFVTVSNKQGGMGTDNRARFQAILNAGTARQYDFTEGRNYYFSQTTSGQSLTITQDTNLLFNLNGATISWISANPNSYISGTKPEYHWMTLVKCQRVKFKNGFARNIGQVQSRVDTLQEGGYYSYLNSIPVQYNRRFNKQANSGCFVKNSGGSFFTFDNIDLKYAAGLLNSASSGSSPRYIPSNLEIKNCRFWSWGATAILTNAYADIHDNYFDNSEAPQMSQADRGGPGYLGTSHAIYTTEGFHAISVHNNVFYKVRGTVIQFNTGTNYNGKAHSVKNNTFELCAEVTDDISGDNGNKQRIAFEGNDIKSCRELVLDNANSTWFVRNNNFWGPNDSLVASQAAIGIAICDTAVIENNSFCGYNRSSTQSAISIQLTSAADNNIIIKNNTFYKENRLAINFTGGIQYISTVNPLVISGNELRAGIYIYGTDPSHTPTAGNSLKFRIRNNTFSDYLYFGMLKTYDAVDLYNNTFILNNASLWALQIASNTGADTVTIGNNIVVNKGSTLFLDQNAADVNNVNYYDNSHVGTLTFREPGNSTGLTGTGHIYQSRGNTFDGKFENLYSPTLIGGTSTTQTLTLQTTSGSATTGSDIIFKDDNTEFARILNNGSFGIGIAAPTSRLHLAGNTTAAAWGVNGIHFNAAAATFTDNSTAGSGTATNAMANTLGIPTFAATNSSVTMTNGANLYIAGPPAAGTNVTITNPWALFVEDGNSRFDGTLRAAVGSVSAPAFSFVAATNYGMYQESSQLRFAAGGAERLGLSSTGANVTGLLTVTGMGTDPVQGYFVGNDENAAIYVQNSSTGTGSTNGLAISMANTDGTINNKESGTLILQTTGQNAIIVNANQTVDLSAYDGTRDANIQVTPTGRIERVEYAIGEIYVDDADPDTITFAGGSTTVDSLDDVTLGDTINFQKVGSSLKYIGTDTALFMLNANLSFSFGEAVIIHAAVFKNQVEDTSIGFERKIGVGGDIGEGGCSGIIKLFPNDRVIVLFFPDAHTGDDNLIVDKYNISLHKLAKL